MPAKILSRVTHAPEFADTDPRALEVWLDLLRQKKPGERVSAALWLTDLTFKMAEAGVRALYPDASSREVFLRAAARRLSRDSMLRCYGWDPESDGDTR